MLEQINVEFEDFIPEGLRIDILEYLKHADEPLQADIYWDNAYASASSSGLTDDQIKYVRKKYLGLTWSIPDPDLEPVTREDARHMALASAIIQTYPDTKEKNTEDLFLRIFWTRICAEYPESNEEDLNWARERLCYLRERGISDETLDSIAELTMAELLALDVDEDEEIHGPFDTVAELMAALNDE